MSGSTKKARKGPDPTIIAAVIGAVALILATIIGVVFANKGPSNPSVSGPTATLTTAPSPTPTLLSFESLDDEADSWTTIQDTVVAKATNIQSPSLDGSALKVRLAKGHPGNSILAYRTLGRDDTVTTFELNLSFYFPSAASIQALGFSVDKWVNHQRWQWKLQWFNFPGAGPPPSWRVFDGKNNWQDTHKIQYLSVNKWHNLQFKGDIVNGQVHYISFSCDDVSANLGQTFAPVSDPGENQLAVQLELDGGAQGNPYEVYFDEVNLLWS